MVAKIDQKAARARAKRKRALQTKRDDLRDKKDVIETQIKQLSADLKAL